MNILLDYMSPVTDKLSEALAQAQGEMPSARKSGNNSFLKNSYATLDDMKDAAFPVLSRYGLSVEQKRILGANGEQYVATILRHKSGQWSSSVVKFDPIKKDIQSAGSYLTYIKRYEFASITGIKTSELDDDGERAMIRESIDQKDDHYSLISPEQVTILKHNLKGHPELEKQIKEKMGINELYELKKGSYKKILERIETIKETKKNDS